MEYYSGAKFAKEIGVSDATLCNWDFKGILVPAKRSITKRKMYSQEQLDTYLAGDYDNPILKGDKFQG